MVVDHARPADGEFALQVGAGEALGGEPHRKLLPRPWKPAGGHVLAAGMKDLDDGLLRRGIAGADAVHQRGLDAGDVPGVQAAGLASQAHGSVVQVVAEDEVPELVDEREGHHLVHESGGLGQGHPQLPRGLRSQGELLQDSVLGGILPESRVHEARGHLGPGRDPLDGPDPILVPPSQPELRLPVEGFQDELPQEPFILAWVIHGPGGRCAVHRGGHPVLRRKAVPFPGQVGEEVGEEAGEVVERNGDPGEEGLGGAVILESAVVHGSHDGVGRHVGGADGLEGVALGKLIPDGVGGTGGAPRPPGTQADALGKEPLGPRKALHPLHRFEEGRHGGELGAVVGSAEGDQPVDPSLIEVLRCPVVGIVLG